MEQEKCPISSCTNTKTRNDDDFQMLLQSLEQRTSGEGRRLLKYHGFWYWDRFLPQILSFQNYFQAKNTDVIIASAPKSGTTWLKALIFSILNRNLYATDQSPLLTSNPQNLIPSLELDIYMDLEDTDLEGIPSPRIFSTHLPFKALPQSIVESECRIVFICRNPLDQFISGRFFSLQNMDDKEAMLELQGDFDLFCQGIHGFGPFWDHILSYWEAHLKNPQKVLFLKYEDLKEDTAFYLKEIAEFMGCPFTFEEECRGLIEDITGLCSFDKLRNLEINKDGIWKGVLQNSSFFRKGEVGDWRNYLSAEMAERMKKMMESKFESKGLTFKV